MSSSRPAVTPTTSSYSTLDDYFSSTPPPPPPNGFAAAGSYTSPSPRTRRASRDVGHPSGRSHFYHDQGAIDSNHPPAVAERPSAPAAVHPHHAPPGPYSTFPPNPPRSSSLAPGNPPRSSSLLPPARIVVDPGSPHDATPFLRDPFNDPRPAPKIPDSVRESDSRHKRGHSRSSSAGGLSDTFRNLNRWSASTTSSRASHLADFTRRVSAEILGVAFHSPGRKLHKRIPSLGASPRSSSQPRYETESPAIPPLQSLPHISTGPSLAHEVLQLNVLGRTSPTHHAGPNRESAEDNGRLWGGQSLAPEEEHEISSYHAYYGEPPRSPGMITHESTMPYTHNGQPNGHARNRSIGAKGSADNTAGSARSREKDRDRDRERERHGKPPSQKAMLSRALQKANTAVQLDNAQNFEGARRAYAEACAVLQQVLLRTTGDEDRRKLEAIHETYLSRVIELDEQLVDIEPEGKALPQRPESNDLHDVQVADEGYMTRRPDSSHLHDVLHAQMADDGYLPRQPETNDMHDVMNAQIADEGYSHPFTGGRERHYEENFETEPNYSAQKPTRSPPLPSRASPLPVETRDPRAGSSPSLTQQYSLQSAFSKARYNNSSTLRPPTMVDAYMPPPLSPRRPLSPARISPPPVQHESPRRPPPETPVFGGQLAPQPVPAGHRRATSHESVSWLDPIDESERSSASSVHSVSSSRIRRKHIRAASGATEAEFDAALDDAIEAAYDEGYELEEPEYHGHSYQDPHKDPVANTLRRVEMARELVRESEREALQLATEREKRLRLQQQLEDEEYRKQEGGGEDFFDGNDSEDEERMLEEMTRGNAIEDFAFGVQPRPPVPRESDSSGMTGRTWHSSMGSNPPTGTTLLTPVSEDNIIPRPSGLAGPSGPLPALPPHAKGPLPPPPNSAGSQQSGESVRNRRLSGQNPKELKIETTKLAPAGPATAGPAVPSQSKAGNYIVQQRQALSAGTSRPTNPLSARLGPSPIPAPVEEDPEDGPLAPMAFSHEEYSRVGTPSVVRPNLRKNYSSSSLKSLKTRNLSISHLEETSDHSPGTPLSHQFGSRLPAVPSLPAGLKDRTNSATTSGLHLFENHFHSPEEPGSPNLSTPDAPAPLEPCPSHTMLRPFWLMRALYQTLCHPRGGYISNKLFVPRDVWRVKGVKLKGIEDKIANCDLLTAALQKLGQVDTCDADAVLEEMQALEEVLEQVQATLTRRLGHEVGVQGSGTMFRDAGNGVEGGDPAAMPRSASVAGKGSSFSWRRLRSKNSSANLPGLATYGKGGSGAGGSTANLHEGAGKDMVLASLPMTAQPTNRPIKRDLGSVSFAGPNANYMASLARLFDAAQTVDQIARQVDDPGLRHADKTQVGLELCTRHAAEFFAFYICRFALSDLTMLMDKFVKRGTEWVLA